MHDIGTSRPGGWGPGYSEFEQELSPELAGEMGGELGNEFESEFESEFEVGEGEFENEFENEVSGEMQEMELAAELLAVNNEQEMEQFLGGLVKSIGRAATNFAKSSAGKALGGILRSAAKSALPIVGGALGNFIVPGAGGLIGGKLASMAGSALGLELEGLSNEDREFEVARRLVRIGQHAAHHLTTMPAHVPPARAARIAFLRAARQIAPGLLPTMRTIAQNGVAAARQTSRPIFGPPGPMPAPAPGLTTGRSVAPHHLNGHPATQGFGYGPTGQAIADPASVPANCPSCGSALQHLTHVPRHGYWRRSRTGRSIVLYLAPPRPTY
ncbi:conserved protein of unknown function [Pararobbsia alpina]|uniref:hypothetical protein n=1 Tax=Pararobbsia alpina TaxID=621374 RepID=UPI0039A4870A